jgi:hypothetical protein
MDNSYVILNILTDIKSTIKSGTQLFFDHLKNGIFPTMTEVKKMTFKNSMLLSLAK